VSSYVPPGPCPQCGIRPRAVTASGNTRTYCRVCEAPPRRVVKLSELTHDQRHLVMALVEANKAAGR
jgi:hypothetical protein